MRRNQVSIHVERFGSEAPEGARVQKINAYGDANNIWEALFAAVNEATKEILKDRPLPSFQRAESDSHVYGQGEPCRKLPNDVDFESQRQVLIWQTGEELRATGKTTPVFFGGIGEWVMYPDDGRTLYGGLMRIADLFTATGLHYRYAGYDGENRVYRKRIVAFDFETVVEAMLRDPEKTSVEAYTKDYSPNELAMLRELKERLLAEEEKA